MKMQTLILGGLVFSLSFPGMTAEAKNDIVIPDEFQTLFDEKPVLVSFQISGLDTSQRFSMVSTPFSAQLQPKAQGALKQFLTQQGVVESAIDDIVASMKEGVSNDPLCTGVVSKCQLIPEYFTFAYDYEHQNVILFVNARALKEQTKKNAPHDSRNNAPGLINHIDLDVNAYQDGDASLTLRNESIVGLPYGSITSKIYANTDDDVSIDELAYNYEWSKQRLQVGHYEYGYAQNTTGTLDLTSSHPLDAVTLSSSRNLIDGGEKANRSLTYVLPGQGRIEVYRNDQLVFGKNVSAGQQKINYSSLPSGNYLATIVVRSQGREVLREQRQIYNTALFSLDKGEWDYTLTAGQFNSRYDDDSDFDELELDASEFVDGRINYQLLDNIAIGARSVVTQEHSLIEGALTQDLGTYASATAKYASFDNDGQFWSVNGTLLGLSLGYEDYSLSNEDYALNNYLLGNTGYQRFTASTGINIAGGNGYLMYIDNSAEEETLLGEQFNDQSSYWSLTAGYSRPFIVDSTLDLSVTWQGGDDEFYDNDEWYANLLWRVPLGSEWTGYSSTSISKRGLDEFRNSVAKSVSGDRYYADTEMGIAYNGNDGFRNVTTDTSFSGGYTGDGFVADTYAYAKTDGTRSFNMGISSSQIFDGDALYFSSKKSDAYVVVDADNEGDSDSHVGLLTIARNGDYHHNKNLDSSQSVIAVENYDQYRVRLDTSSSNYVVNGSSENQEYTFPGSVISLNVDLTKIKTFITSFEDIQSNHIEDIKCVGDGCIEVEKLTDGVFKVSVVVGADYQLVSNAQTCLTPTLDRKTSKIVNLGMNYCLPGIDNDSIQLAALQSATIGGDNYYFVGMYSDPSSLQIAANEINAAGLEAISRRVNSRHYLYAKSDQMLTTAQTTQLELLWRYAIRTLETERWVLWR
ncbi:TcfC E-set like domain-containing protein [Vibrio parahaemolyticus]|uniref:TcfC E-set like domain-containing protein n=1 Tax=Vibrio parahaemolyticus TaxID=670 RepID=UPI0004F30E65|nr:TcfC E-set like domain-containing protein [Vibrio parahaemolyticus]